MSKTDKTDSIRTEIAEKHGLNAKQAAFACEYIVDCCATQAAARAGYSKKTANQQGARLLTHEGVAAAIKDLQAAVQKRADVTVDDVVQQLAHVALFDPRQLFDDAGEPIHISQLPDSAALAIQGVKVVTVGNSDVGRGTVLEYRMADRNSAADKLMKHLGGFEADNKQKLGDLSTPELMEELRRKLLGAGVSMSDLLDASA